MEARQLLAGAAAGAIAGALGAAAFLVFHAAVIVPIWKSAGTGLVGGAIAGAIMGAALTLVYPHPTLREGLRAGALLWGGVLVVGGLLQLARLVRPAGMVEEIGSVAVAAAYGALAGYGIRRSRRAAVGGAIAHVVIVIMAAGPLAPTPRGIAIFASLLPVLALFGVAWAALRRVTDSPTRSWSACISPARPAPDPDQIPIP